uniref:Uncharacterized protein n=1 Tax=Marmota marmota marmota TaxID=9994 RepID=A0A8C5ZTS9_MARMA
LRLSLHPPPFPRYFFAFGGLAKLMTATDQAAQLSLASENWAQSPASHRCQENSAVPEQRRKTRSGKESSHRLSSFHFAVLKSGLPRAPRNTRLSY